MRKNCVFSVLLLGTVLLGIGGCGSDEDELENLIGTWNIVSINRKTPAKWLLPVFASEDVTTTVTVKKADIVFSANGAMFWNIDAEVEYNLQGVFLKFVIDIEVKGTYAVSGATVSWVADVSVDFDLLGVSKNQQQAFDTDIKQTTERIERILKEDFDVGFVSAIWRLDADTLTLIEDDGDETVLSKRQ